MNHRLILYMQLAVLSCRDTNDITAKPDDNDDNKVHAYVIKPVPKIPELELCESIKTVKVREHQQNRKEIENIKRYHNRIQNTQFRNCKGRKR